MGGGGYWTATVGATDCYTTTPTQTENFKHFYYRVVSECTLRMHLGWIVAGIVCWFVDSASRFNEI